MFLNLSGRTVKIKPELAKFNGSYVDVPFSDSLRLEAWKYLILVK